MEKPTRDQFADWINGKQPEADTDTPEENSNAYPVIEDSGEVQSINKEKSPRDQFKDWFYYNS